MSWKVSTPKVRCTIFPASEIGLAIVSAALADNRSVCRWFGFCSARSSTSSVRRTSLNSSARMSAAGSGGSELSDGTSFCVGPVAPTTSR